MVEGTLPLPQELRAFQLSQLPPLPHLSLHTTPSRDIAATRELGVEAGAR